MTEDTRAPALHSISVRVRRTIREDAYVTVLVREELTTLDPDGTRRLDGARVLARAVELSATPGLDWQLEESSAEVHPVQRARPDDRRALHEHELLGA